MVKTIIDPKTKKRLYFYGSTEREINRKILAFTEQVKVGRTFSEVADEWWEKIQTTLSPNSIHTYRAGYQRATQEFGDLRIRSITTKEIQQYIQKFSQSAMKPARKTVANQLMVIGLIFKYGVLEGECDYNVAQGVVLPKGLTASKRSAASQTDEEIIKANPKLWLFPYFILYTGLRKGEALALKGSDIDLKNRLIYVTKSVYFVSNKPHIKEPKTEAGIRTVPILDKLLPYIPKLQKDEYLFPSVRDKKEPMGYSLFQTRMAQYHKKTGTTFGTHQLRHSYATILFECGIEAKTAQHLLGHAQISTTLDIYTDFRKKAEQEAARMLNQKLSEQN